MKKLIFITLFLLQGILIGISSADEVTVFDETFTRDTRLPFVALRTFHSASGLVTLKLTNETHLNNGISGISVKINDKRAFDPSEFNQNIRHIEKKATLKEGENTLTVLLQSEPQGKVRIQICRPLEITPVLIAKVPDNTVVNSLSLISPTNQVASSDEALEAAKALNYCEMSLFKIVSYNDRIVLDEEYSEIINNINLAKIHDEEIIDLLKSLMDAISRFKLNEGDKAIFMKEYEEHVRNALYEGIGNLASLRILASGNPFIAAAGMAVNVGSAYANYRNNMGTYKRDLDKSLWDLQKTAILELNLVRKEFLSSSWKLMNKYKIPDKWRLTEKQMGLFVEATKDKDPSRRLRQLTRLKEDFDAYPPFDYYLGQAAQDLKFYEIAMQAYDKFEREQMGFFREDNLYSSTLMNKIQMLNPASDRDTILRHLKTIEGQSPMDGRKNLFLGLWYVQFGKYKEARERFQTNIDNDFNITLNEMLLGDTYAAEHDKSSVIKLINDMLREENTRNHQILYLVGKLPETEVINKMKDQILGIYVSVKKNWFAKDNLILTLPDKWVIRDFKNFKATLFFRGEEYQSNEVTTDSNQKLLYYHYEKVFDANEFLKKGMREKLEVGLTSPEFPVTLVGELIAEPVWVKGKQKRGIYFKKMELRTIGGCYRIVEGKNIELCK